MNPLKVATLSADLRCDHLIVGSGAGASVAGLELARAGLDVVMLEEGDHHDTASFGADIGRQTGNLYRNGGLTPWLGKPSIAFAEGRCVGGTTVINGGLIWRTPPHVLREWEQDLGLTGFDAGSLDRHFATVERHLNVEPTRVDAGGGNLDSVRLHAGAGRLGWESIVVPRAVRDCRNSNLCATGCPTGAKQSVALSYLPQATAHGLRLFPRSRVVRIEHRNGRVTGVVVQTGPGFEQLVRIRCDHLILGAGAIQSPHLLRRSGLLDDRPAFQFHLNLKFVVDFAETVDAGNGTIFTTQVQEFQREGMLMMAANIQPAYAALPFAGRPGRDIEPLLQRYAHLAICTTMIRPRGRGTIHSWSGREPLLTARLAAADDALMREAVLKSARLFFAAGAERLYLPIKKAPCVNSEQEAGKLLAQTRPQDFELVSVHAMASLPMAVHAGESRVDESGLLRGCKNLHVIDASILPSNIGESPQGTIMGFAHQIAERYLERRSES